MSESSAGPTRTLEPQHARPPLRVETDPCPPTPSVSPAPIPELAHGHGADGHSGEYLRGLEVLTAPWGTRRGARELSNTFKVDLRARGPVFGTLAGAAPGGAAETGTCAAIIDGRGGAIMW